MITCVLFGSFFNAAINESQQAQRTAQKLGEK